MKLTSTAIVDAAIALVNETGWDGFTTRKLASRLGIRGPSLYHHFARMELLTDAMALELMHRFVVDIAEGGGWQDYLRRFAEQGRRMCKSCRDGARILTAPVPRSRAREDIATKHAHYLMREGFGHDEAYRALGLVSSFVGGWSLNEQNRHEWLSSVMDVDANFERSVADILVGLEARFATTSARASPLRQQVGGK